MTDIRLPAPQSPPCPLCGGETNLIESRTRTSGKVIDVYKCATCSVHVPHDAQLPSPPKVIEP